MGAYKDLVSQIKPQIKTNTETIATSDYYPVIFEGEKLEAAYNNRVRKVMIRKEYKTELTDDKGNRIIRHMYFEVNSRNKIKCM